MPQKSSSKQRPTVSIVGPGNLGSALALTLSAASYPVKFIAARQSSTGLKHSKALAKRAKARLVILGKEPLESDIVWLAVPDDEIAAVARSLSTVARLGKENCLSFQWSIDER